MGVFACKITTTPTTLCIWALVGASITEIIRNNVEMPDINRTVNVDFYSNWLELFNVSRFFYFYHYDYMTMTTLPDILFLSKPISAPILLQCLILVLFRYIDHWTSLSRSAQLKCIISWLKAARYRTLI